MNMERVLKERIVALESIVEHLPETCQGRRERYQEKCDIYRRLLADVVRERQTSGDNRTLN